MADQPQALAKQGKQDLRGLMQGDAFKEAVKMALPKHLTPERFIRTCLTALMRVPKLANCSQESVFKCMLDLSMLGLEPDGRRAHLIPYGNECTLIIDYKGLVELMKRSGDVADVQAMTVCENDDFEFDRGEVTKHRIDFRKTRGAMYAVYCRIRFKDETEHFEVLTKEEVDKIRKRSKAKDNGPWVTDYDEMAKKTACRRASKWVVLSPELNTALDVDDQEYDRRVRESSVVDLGKFLPSADANRGHDSTMPMSSDELKDDVEAARTKRQAELDALPDLESMPDPMDYKPTDIVKVKGKFYVAKLDLSAWEPYKP